MNNLSGEVESNCNNIKYIISKCFDINNVNEQKIIELETKINKLTEELKLQKEENKNLTKISVVQHISKQLNEKDTIISELNKVIEKLKKEKQNEEFDPDKYIEINGFELLLYKKKCYLKDLETAELYDIVNYKPNKNIGLINHKNKIIFN